MLENKVSITPDELPPITFQTASWCPMWTPLRDFRSSNIWEWGSKGFPYSHRDTHSQEGEQKRRPKLPSPNPVACLALEKIIVEILYAYFLSRNVVDENQHGFVKGRSIVTQLLITRTVNYSRKICFKIAADSRSWKGKFAEIAENVCETTDSRKIDIWSTNWSPSMYWSSESLRCTILRR